MIADNLPASLDRLAGVVAGATDGPWSVGPPHVIRSVYRDEQGRRCTRYVAECVNEDVRDAAYIATFNPDLVGALLEVVRHSGPTNPDEWIKYHAALSLLAEKIS